MGWLDLARSVLYPSAPRDLARSVLYPPAPRVPRAFVGDYAYYDDGTQKYIGQGNDPMYRYFDEYGYYNGGDLDYQPSVPLPPDNYSGILPDLDYPYIQDEPDFL